MKKLTKVLVFNLILIVMIFSAGNILREKWEYKSDQYKFRYEKMKDFSNSDTKTLFLGSSGSFTAINQAKIFENSGIPVFSLAHNLQSPFASYHLFEDYIKENKDVKLLFQDILGLTREVNPNIEHHETNFFYALTAIDNKKGYIQGLKNEFDKDYTKGYYIPILKYHDRWNRLKKEDFFEIEDKEEITSFQVKKVKPVNFTPEYMKYDKNFKKSEVGEKYLTKIINLAKSNDIEVILYILPKMDYTLNEIEEYHKFAKKHNLKIIDFTSEKLYTQLGIDTKTDFYDNAHLNYNGGKKISKYFANYISTNYPEYKENISNETKQLFEKEIEIINRKYEK